MFILILRWILFCVINKSALSNNKIKMKMNINNVFQVTKILLLSFYDVPNYINIDIGIIRNMILYYEQNNNNSYL